MDLLFGCLLSVLFVSIGIVLYVKHSYTYWKRKGVYSPLEPTLLFGNILPMLRSQCRIREYFKDIYDKSQRNSKTMAGIYILLKPILVVTDLDLVKNIMNNDFEHFSNHAIYSNEADPVGEHLAALKGESWRHLRAQLTPAFTPARTKRMFQKLITHTDKLVDTLTIRCSDNENVKLSNLIERYTIRLSISCVYGIECDDINNFEKEFRYYLENFFSASPKGVLVTFLSFFNPSPLTFFKIRSVRKDVGDFFLKLAYENIKFREDNHGIRDDYMHLLCQLRHTDDAVKNPQPFILTDAHVAANCLMLSIADYETSTPVISFCLYELAINADIQNKARDEVTEVLAKYNEDFCYDAVKDMTYLEKCVKETLRKYAPASVHPRECTKPYTDPHTGIEIDQGTLTFIPVHGLHMDPNIFPNPERFDPERFSNDAISSRHPCSWIPFGFGPRMCLGMKPGIAKVKVCLAKLLQHFEFSTSHLTEIPLVIKPRAFITKSANGVWLNMKKIN